MNRSACLALSVALGASAAFQTSLAAEGKPRFQSQKVHETAVPIHVELTGAKELYLVVTDAGDGFTADWADWMEPVLTKADGSKIKLTEMPPKIAKVGWRKLEVNARPDGNKPMKVAGQEVPFGFGAHAPSMIAFDLPTGVVAFDGRGGVDEGGVSQGSGATVVFEVYTENPGEKVIAPSVSRDPSANGKPYGYEEAKAQMQNFTAAPGLQVGLFAAEPQIENPTNIDIDHRGRVWAVEAVNYRKWSDLRPEGDRVVILEDSNGNGVANKETTFWQSPELKWPLGICVLPQAGRGKPGTAVIVSAAPNVWLLQDTDGDDKADKVTKLFTTGGVANHDHNIHAFSFGADGKLYFNMGNEAQKLMWPDGTPVKDVAGHEITNKGTPYRQGMVFRCDLDPDSGKVSNIETLGWNFRNNYEVCVDSFGTLWQSDNDDDGNRGVRINYVMDYGNFGYTDEVSGAGWQSKRTNWEQEIPLRHWHQNDPGVVPNLLQTGGGSPTGILVNEGTLLGPQFTNQIIHCDAGPRIVRAYPVTPDGAGYKASIINVLESKDNWYRPADLAIAPDGSLFIADWYDGVVGGHNMTDHEPGKIRGRIYRVAPEAGKYTVAKPDFSSVDGAIAALQSPNKATQYVAWQKLHALGAQAEPALQKLRKSENPRFRARALALLVQLPGRDHYIAAGLSDPDPNIRIAAMRMGREQAAVNPNPDWPETKEAAARLLESETNPQVNREFAIALSIVKDRESIADGWAQLARKYDGRDRWYLEALGIGARGAENECLEAWLKIVSSGWNTPAGRDIIWRLRGTKSLPYLEKILTDPQTTEAEAPRYLREYDFIPAGAEKTNSLVRLAELGLKRKLVAEEALDRLKNVDLTANEGVRRIVTSLLQASKGTARFVELVRDFKVSNQGDGLLEIAIKAPSSPEGVEAAKMLLSPDYNAIVDGALRGAAALSFVEALGNTADKRSLPFLINILTNATQDAAQRKQAVKSLVQSPAGIETLLDLARKGTFPNDLKLTAASALAAVQVLPQIKGDVAQYFPLPNALGGQALPPISALAKMKGDAQHGKALFAKEETVCVTCHKAGSVGVDFAPALSEIGTKLGKEAIYEAIIDPNAGITMGFETTMLTLKDGGSAMGIVRSETEDEVILAMPRGVQNRYKKSDITKREKLPTSMMPPGLQQLLSTQDFVDLVEYLASLKAAAPAASK